MTPTVAEVEALREYYARTIEGLTPDDDKIDEAIADIRQRGSKIIYLCNFWLARRGSAGTLSAEDAGTPAAMVRAVHALAEKLGRPSILSDSPLDCIEELAHQIHQAHGVAQACEQRAIAAEARAEALEKALLNAAQAASTRKE